MKLASIETILDIQPIPNADSIVLAKVLGFDAIIKKDQYKIGDTICFIQPDTVLPDGKSWSVFYRSKSNRVKAIRLRKCWSQGIIESLSNVEYNGPVEIGREISSDIGVIKYEAPMPQDLSASGPYGFGIPKTDEERAENLSDIPYGELVDITIKIDGQSISFIYNNKLNAETGEYELIQAVGGRSFLYKWDCQNNYTKNERQYNVIPKLRAFCAKYNVNLCIRGESAGNSIQSFANNPSSKEPLFLSLYSVWLIDEMRYARKGDKFYIHEIAKELDLPTVPIIEKDVILTPELIKKYSEVIDNIDGKSFEGVVVQHRSGSFKIVNKHYDSKK